MGVLRGGLNADLSLQTSVSVRVYVWVVRAHPSLLLIDLETTYETVKRLDHDANVFWSILR